MKINSIAKRERIKGWEHGSDTSHGSIFHHATELKIRLSDKAAGQRTGRFMVCLYWKSWGWRLLRAPFITA